MHHDEVISRSKPGAFLFLIDQSGSMSQEFGRRDENGHVRSKAEVVADAINRTLDEIILSCVKGEDGIRNYFEIGLIGYGQRDVAAFCWEKSLSGRELVPISEVRPAADIEQVERETENFGQLRKTKVSLSVWLKPTAAGGTPMKSAFVLARDVLESWISAHPDSYPPIVINITDGQATDIASNDELATAATSLTSLKNNQGSEVLLINCHISNLSDAPILFPSRSDGIPLDPYAQVLFQMSSVLPSKMASVAAEMSGSAGSDPMRGMVFNGNAITLIKCLRVGTVPTKSITDFASRVK